ncbi:MAG: flagellar basal-body rod protein FlgF [Deltaproteobacteria bacterium]|nr:flagellar basal-body rod protein FlgF [Deltaproteobacteria bacterium]
MTNGIYSAVLGARVQDMRLDVIANNVANADTPGFRRDVPVFSTQTEYLPDKRFDRDRASLGDANRFFAAVPSFQPGPVHHTGRMGDMAIEGDGFFVVMTPNGEAYTRGGAFQVDPQGYLATGQGYQVMGQGGPIQVEPGAEFTVGTDGTINVGDQSVDKLRIAAFEERVSASKMGKSLLVAAPDAEMVENPEFTIVDRALEGSNVNIVREMADMIAAGRQFEAYQRTIRMFDEINKSSSQSLGRI